MGSKSSHIAVSRLGRLASWLSAILLMLQGSICSPGQTALETAKPSSAQETLVLVGTMGYAQEQLAFFDGSDPGFRQVLHVGDDIGGWSVKDIGFKQVTLKARTQEVELAVGTYLRRKGGGEWQFGGDAASTFTPPTAVSHNSAITTAKPAPPVGFAVQPKAGDHKDLEHWAEKKLTKQLAEMEGKVKKEKNSDKAAAKWFQEALKKADKRHKHGQG